jgi:hypothetical protein
VQNAQNRGAAAEIREISALEALILQNPDAGSHFGGFCTVLSGAEVRPRGSTRAVVPARRQSPSRSPVHVAVDDPGRLGVRKRSEDPLEHTADLTIGSRPGVMTVKLVTRRRNGA